MRKSEIDDLLDLVVRLRNVVPPRELCAPNLQRTPPRRPARQR